MLHRNVGGLDRALRVAIGIVLLPVGLFLLDGLGGSVLGLTLATIGFVGLGRVGERGQRLLSPIRANGLLDRKAERGRTVALKGGGLQCPSERSTNSRRIPGHTRSLGPLHPLRRIRPNP